jgi:hypothetical protein
VYILGSWNITTTSSTDTCTSGNRGYATRRVRALAVGKYRSRFLRHHLALLPQNWRGYSLGILRRPIGGKRGVKTYAWQPIGAVRNIHRGDPSILNAKQSAMTGKFGTAGVGPVEVGLPGSFTEDMVVPGRERKKGKGGSRRGKRVGWGIYKARQVHE